jgi:hypothetical protein
MLAHQTERTIMMDGERSNGDGDEFAEDGPISYNKLIVG